MKRGQVHFPALDLGRPRGLSSTVIMNLTLRFPEVIEKRNDLSVACIARRSETRFRVQLHSGFAQRRKHCSSGPLKIRRAHV